MGGEACLVVAGRRGHVGGREAFDGVVPGVVDALGVGEEVFDSRVKEDVFEYLDCS